MLLKNLCAALVPLILVAGTLWLVWWYVVIHQQVAVEAAVSGVEQLGTPGLSPKASTPAEQGPALAFYLWFAGIAAVCADNGPLLFETECGPSRMIKLLTSSVMPLGILTVIVLAVILFRITTATESAGVGAASCLHSPSGRELSTGNAPRRRYS
jgi:TRAP-type mannitol/chloroaromatic compound transport system permease large subunit